MTFPIVNGKYEVTPGLRKLNLGRDNIFLRDADFDQQVAYKQMLENSPLAHHATIRSGDIIHEVLTSASRRYSKEWQSTGKAQLEGRDIQEDLAIIEEHDGTNSVIYLDVLFPNGWNPQEKIGGTFASVHAPVAHFERMAAMEQKIVGAMIDHGPFERFAWGVHTTSRLDRLEIPDDWTCPFEQMVFRVERQTTMGFPRLRAALFTIHTSVVPLDSLTQEEKAQVASALRSMDGPAQAYKGLTPEAIERVASHLLE